MINWKQVARSPGYISLKRAYMHDVKKDGDTKVRLGRSPMRSKETLYAKFQWVIKRAQHYAHATGEPIEKVLNRWEAGRDYWWLNYYQEARQPKIPKGPKLPNMGLQGLRKNNAKMYRGNPADLKRANCLAAQIVQERASSKKRWSKHLKAARARYKQLHKNL